ncbi:ABC transporter permease [Halobacillus sp. ACCC02827]|uniref:ABC transporter permease n=1 Tax=Bacillaceae TaxID=186817 RepID=UPI0002A4FE99|nr:MULTISPECIES: ABC transporter permease [Bacillaceae]ELK45429.1 antibiotic ABC transporter permease [Halobacillus sp. BAB-2008]QHT46424.1 ABC transporter permease [Bacillus sp. SB49]WJE17232.1 ABC transporter permease [Halobacillus sp. ACCC02827]
MGNNVWKDTWLLTVRSIKTTIRNPFSFIPNLIISVFFLLVYDGGLSGISQLPTFEGANYLAFILPVSIVSAAIGGAGGAGQGIVKDIENGFFSRLLLTPASRLAIVLGPIIAGMLQLLVQTVLIFGIAFLMGLEVKTGFLGMLFVLLIAIGWGLAFAGYSAGVALRTKNAQASQAGTFIFFPLIFLSTTFVPYDLIEAQWLKVAAAINPTTYVFESMRTVMIDGWVFGDLMKGVIAILIACAITITFAAVSAKKAVARG